MLQLDGDKPSLTEDVVTGYTVCVDPVCLCVVGSTLSLEFPLSFEQTFSLRGPECVCVCACVCVCEILECFQLNASQHLFNQVAQFGGKECDGRQAVRRSRRKDE